MTYRIEKISVKVGHNSGIKPGDTVTSNEYFIKKSYDGIDNIIESPDLTDIEVGDTILVISNRKFIKTSAITSILDINNYYIEFETTTSTYKLDMYNEQ